MDPKFNYVVRGQGVYFGMGMPFTIQRDMLAKGAKTELVVNPDSQIGKVGNTLWASSAKIAGMQVMEPLLFAMNTTDFGPLATKVKNLNPDFAEFAYVTGDQITNIIGALRDVGYKGKVYPGNINPFVLENIVKKVGKEYVEGWECVFHDPKGSLKDPEMLALIDRYTKEYGEWRTEGCFWIGPWFIFKDAVEATKSADVDVIVKYLQNSKHAVKTFFGYSQLFARPDIKNLKTIDAACGSMVGVIKNGKLVPLRAVTVKDQYLVSIKAYGLADVYEKHWEQHGYPTLPKQESLFDFADLKK